MENDSKGIFFVCAFLSMIYNYDNCKTKHS